MKRSLMNVWVGLAYGQIRCYQVATEMVAKGTEACWQIGPQSLVDSCMPRSVVPLNPLEFHGRRRPERSPRSHAGKRLV